jgi:hypothetical protein
MSDDAEQDARTFFVDSRFEQMARRPGGMPRDEALERAQATIDEIRPSFAEWLDSELKELSRVVEQNGPHGSNDPNWVDTAHTLCLRIRDVGTTMGFDLVTFVAGNLSEIFDAINSGTDYRADLIECHIQALLLARQEQYRNLRPEHLPELSSGLRRVAEYAPKSNGHAPKAENGSFQES